MLHFVVLCGKTAKTRVKPHPARDRWAGLFFEGIDCYVRSGTPAEEETPPVRGFSAPERHLTGKQRPPDFSLLKKPRPIRSYFSGEQTARQAGSRRAVCSKASKSALQGYSGQALQ